MTIIFNLINCTIVIIVLLFNILISNCLNLQNGSFFRKLCRNESFHEFAALRREDPSCEIDTEVS
jgi:hypothetical protein